MPRRTSETEEARWPGNRRSPKASFRLPSDGDLRELIAIRAYELYVQRGSAQGDETTDWLMAEAEVMSALHTSTLYTQPSPTRSRNGVKKTASKLTAPSRTPRTLAAASSRKTRPKSEAA
jgi:hypothetical protein